MISNGAGEGSSGGPGAAVSGLKKGPWTASEDEILIQYVQKHGEGNWNAVQKQSRLNRCGKSCRLRWANHLRPNLKKGSFTPDEENLILELHSKYGNKWARMATHLPGRTDNEIKNYWNTRVKRRKRQGLPLYPNETNQHSQQQQQQQQQQLPSPSGLTNATPTPPTTPTPTNFPFHTQPIQFQSNINNNNLFDPTQNFSFQYRPVPLLASPLTCLKSPYALPHGGHTPLPFATFSGATGFENCGVVSPGSVNLKTELPSNQYHHHHQQHHHHQHHLQHEMLQAPNVNDFLDTLIEDGHMSIESSSEFMPKEEAKEHINSLPDDLSKLVFVPSGAASFQPTPVAPAHHWYNSHVSTGDFSGDMQHLAATFFPVTSPSTTTTTTASTTDYSHNPTLWETLPGIGKGCFKNT